ncbi:MAG: glycine cleavage T C-terminal barrel domain-containing protein [Acidimicrobiales bacterium]
MALAFLPPHAREGHEVSIDARGQRLPAEVVATPFVRKNR